jgi:hypothetical protein
MNLPKPYREMGWDDWITHWRAEANADTDFAARLTVLKDTPVEQMLYLLALPETHSKIHTAGWSVGSHLEIGGPRFYCDVFKAAFYCYRRSLLDPALAAEFAQKSRALKDAEEARAIAAKAVPIEFRGSLYSEES